MSSHCCRLCMRDSLLNNIFKSNDIYRMISLYIDSQVHEYDGLPPYVCLICEEKIVNFHDFKKKCLEISNQLRFIVQNAKSNIKILSESELQDAASCGNVCEDDKCSDDATSKKSSNIKLEHNSSESMITYNLKTESYLEENVIQQPHTNKCDIEIFQGRDEITKTKVTLRKHKQTTADAKEYLCKLCSKQFTRSAHLIVHMRIHLGIKPYICEYCGRAFTKKQDLNRHFRIHSEEKKYSCPKCNRKFKRTGDVYSHLRTHTEDRPYKCYQCLKSYKSPTALHKHKGTCIK